MSLLETWAQEPTFACNISLNGDRGDWYWEVKCGGTIIARGLAATQAQARRDMDAVISACAHPTPTGHLAPA